MTDILFGQSYYLRFDPKLWQAMQPYPPLGTLYAAAYLRQRGYGVSLFDAMLAAGEDEWAAALAAETPTFAVIYEDTFNYLSKMCLLRMRQAAFTMIRTARQKGHTVIVCGADATDHWAAYLAQGAHYVLVGEGEITLAELLDRLTGRTDTALAAIQGLAYLSETDGQPRVTRRRPDIQRLDELPFPAWDLVDIDAYRRIWSRRHGYFSMNMATTRGCPFHCNWCAKPIWGQRYNSRTPENVMAEVAQLRATYGPDHIWFVDDIMGLKPGWMGRFADLAAAGGNPIPFRCLSRVDLLLRPGEISALRRSGCEMVWVGAESGSQRILDAMEKGTRVDQIYAATERLHAEGIGVGFFLQFGYPGERWPDIEKTLQMVRDCRPDDIGMSVSYPLPGTSFHAAVQAQLGAKRNWTDSNDLAMLYHGPHTTAFYRQLHRVLHKEFRIRSTWRRLRAPQEPRSWRRPTSAHPAARLRPVGAMGFHLATLPWERYRLRQMARAAGDGPHDLTPALTQEEAARPTPQRN